MIDTNIHLSRWPFRRLKYDETSSLIGRLKSRGVSQAWAGSFDGLLHKDIASVNRRLAEECQKSRGFLVPFGSVNPALPDWEEDLRRCAEEHKMPGIRLHPNYHNYKLDDPAFARLLQRAAERKLLVQLAVLMEDRRMQHPLIAVPPVDLGPLASIVKSCSGLRLQMLNSLQVLRGQPLLNLMASGEVYFDMATLEGIGGLANLIGQVPIGRVCLGSHSPFFIFESAEMKLKESPLTETQTKAIKTENARRLLAR